MNKKGQEGGGIGFWVGMGMAVAVVVIVIVGISFWFSEKAIPFAEYLPGFNQSKPLLIDQELFRYTIMDGKVQFYDGNKWDDFPENGVEINGKTINYWVLRDELTKPFFDSINLVNVNSNENRVEAPVVVNVDFTDDSVVKYKFNRDSKRWEYYGAYFGGWGDVKDIDSSSIVTEAYSPKNKQTAGELNTKNEAEGYLYFVKQMYENPINSLVMLEEGITGIPFEWFTSFFSKSVIVGEVETCFIKEYYSGEDEVMKKEPALVVDLSRHLLDGEKGCPY